jgi:hypothetical protein
MSDQPRAFELKVRVKADDGVTKTVVETPGVKIIVKVGPEGFAKIDEVLAALPEAIVQAWTVVLGAEDA